MRYGSVCSGVEAASLAWGSLGWKPSFFAEIDKFPRAVMQERWPNVPVHGDFTTIQKGDYDPIDVLVGGTPCQDFSVAGLRKGIAGDRGNLTLQFVKLLDRLRPRWFLLENVPGFLSINEGRAFGNFLGALAECGYGFAYRVYDAQYFGLAQRRERLFVVGYLGDWRRAAAVLFEPESLSGNPAPRREKGKSIAPTVTAGPSNGGPAHGARSGSGKEGLIVPVAFGGNNTSGPIDVATARNEHSGPCGRLDFESETFVATAHISPSLRAQAQASHRADSDVYVAHALRGDGFDASEDGTGRGTPLVASRVIGFNGRQDKCPASVAGALDEDAYSQCIAFSAKDHGADASVGVSPTLRAGGHDKSHANAGVMPAVCIPIDMRQASRGEKMTNNRAEGSSGGAPGTGVGSDGDPSPTLGGSREPAVAYSIMPQNSGKDYKARVVDVAQPVMAAGPGTGNQGGDVILHTDEPFTFESRYARNGRGAPSDLVPPLKAQSGETGKGDAAPLLAITSGVQRLMPVECEKLQGMPPNHTLVTYCGKPAADGPRYKAIGNSFPVPVIRRIGERIAEVDKL